MALRRAVLDPMALGLLGASLALAVAVQIVEPWSGRSLWIACWGLVAAALTVVAKLAFRPTEQPPALAAGVTPEPVSADAPSSEGPGPEVIETTGRAIAFDDVVRLVGQALRDLDKTGRLAQSELITLLPRTLAATRASKSTGNNPATPEEQAHALAEVLNTAVDRLKPYDAGRPSEKRQDAHYKILHEEYRLGMPPTQIMVRLEVTDATFFRWRNEAVSAVARELMAREDRLRLRGADDPTAMDYLG
jgi:hypothetical protein